MFTRSELKTITAAIKRGYEIPDQKREEYRREAERIANDETRPSRHRIAARETLAALRGEPALP